MDKVANYILTPAAMCMVVGSSNIGAYVHHEKCMINGKKGRGLDVLYLQLEKYKERLAWKND